MAPETKPRDRNVPAELEQRIAASLPAEHASLAGPVGEAVAAWLAERKGASAELAPVDGVVADVLDAIFDPVMVVDTDAGRIIHANEAACAMLGYDHDELCRLSIGDIHPYELQEVAEFTRRIDQFGRWQTDELTCRSRDGQFIPAELSGSRFRYRGRPAMLVVARDQREHKLAMLGAAVSKIVHDLRNALSATQLFSDVLKRVDDPTVRAVLPRLHGALDRATRLCNATLAHGRVQEPRPQPQSVPLRPLAEEVAVGLGLNVQERPVAWDNQVPETLEVFADPDQLYRILLNLMRNAVEALHGQQSPAPVLRLGAEHSEGAVELVLTDNGPGLPAAVEQRLADSQACPVTGGTQGLGLLIVRELVELHDGALEAVSNPDRGTTFRVRLPLPQGSA